MYINTLSTAIDIGLIDFQHKISKYLSDSPGESKIDTCGVEARFNKNKLTLSAQDLYEREIEDAFVVLFHYLKDKCKDGKKIKTYPFELTEDIETKEVDGLQISVAEKKYGDDAIDVRIEIRYSLE